ncbi:MAG: hypothetical protein J0L82_12415 [Deltaproteobacteria bacterium]|nr:hypothetical protein [Deltaproteobacteria bacterium]
MENFELLGTLAQKLHAEMRSTYYLMLPIFFCLSLAVTWLKTPTGGPDFLEAVKRAFISTLLLAGFQEITDTILFVTSGLADKISDMQGLDMFMQMAGEKTRSYTVSSMSLLIGFNDLFVATLTFLSYVILYFSRFIMVAVYHFSWVFLSLIAPIVLLFHLFSPKITLNLFKSLIEVASWKVVWAVLSAMLAALPFGNAYASSGGYLTVIILNFVIAIAMLGTPLVVRSLVGSGFSSFASSLGPVTAGAMFAAPAKAVSAMTAGRSALNTSRGIINHYQNALQNRAQRKDIERGIKALNSNPKRES